MTILDVQDIKYIIQWKESYFGYPMNMYVILKEHPGLALTLLLNHNDKLTVQVVPFRIDESRFIIVKDKKLIKEYIKLIKGL